MKKGNLSEDKFSYKEDPNLRFSFHNFILAIKDEDFPEKNIIPILYYKNGAVVDIDEYDMERINTHPGNTDASLSGFNLNQLLKISRGAIISDKYYTDGAKRPKCLTYTSNITATETTEVVEILSGIIYESTSKIKLNDIYLDSLILDVYIENKAPVFIETENKLIGPFRILAKDSEGYFNVEKNLWKQFGEYELTDKSYIEFIANQISRKIYIPSFNELLLLKELDFKKDDEIIKEFLEKVEKGNENLDIENQKKILDILLKTSKIKSVEEYINKNNRIATILENSENIISSNVYLYNLIPEIASIKNEIERLQNRESDLKLSVSDISKKLDDLQHEVQEKEEDIRKRNEDLQNLVSVREDELKKIQIELEAEVAVLREKKNNIELEIQKETQNKSKELAELKEQISHLKKENDELEYTNTELRQHNKDVQRDAQKELINIFKQKKYFDFLNGRDLSDFEDKDKCEKRDYTINDKYSDFINFRKDLMAILNKHGRNYETHFVDNLLISIHQNTLTVLAGLPGTGKTSLARLLTKALTPKERICEVSVSRGWSSQKDLIGFLNPLNNKFHSAPTGVYELLTQLDSESTDQKCLMTPLAYIILDEANLSPIEHYWSVFYNLTDSFASEDNLLSISLGNNLSLKFSNNLRFIATINVDQTTESLSPRVIDRVNIIQIPITNFRIDTLSNEDIDNLSISYQKCIEFFNLPDFRSNSQTIELSEDLDNIYSEIKKQFKSLKILISPRVEIGIKQYCSVAQKLMTKELARPLDYCVAQRLLPMINLQGESARSKLNELLNIFKENDLRKSMEILERIIKLGDEDGFFEGNYNYFLTMSHA